MQPLLPTYIDTGVHKYHQQCFQCFECRTTLTSTYVAIYILARAAGVRLAAQTAWMQVVLALAFALGIASTQAKVGSAVTLEGSNSRASQGATIAS